MIKSIKINFLMIILSGLLNLSFGQDKKIKVLQLNIWQEGTQLTGGYEGIVDEINALEPDLVTLSEVRNYKNTNFTSRLINDLKLKGKTYYSFYSNGAGILSAYPITDSSQVFGGKGEIYKLVTKIKEKEIAVYSAHLDYLNYAVYLPRGYSGSTWEKLDKPVTDIQVILADNLASSRDEAIRSFVEEAKKDIEKGRLIFLGGDFNEASHLDWTAATKDKFDHKGLIIPWQNSITLYKNGFKDSYRVKYPDPLKYPGFTFPAGNKDVAVKKLAWAPDADERERIDFIYYYPNRQLKLENSYVVGPSTSIVKNERVEETSSDIFILPSGTWPTDHKGVMSIFVLK
jgi:endonuclease/exonuclease/phosphatase family metal-dependent hydrolase